MDLYQFVTRLSDDEQYFTETIITLANLLMKCFRTIGFGHSILLMTLKHWLS